MFSVDDDNCGIVDSEEKGYIGGMTPIGCCITNESCEVAQLLVEEYNADPNQTVVEV